MIYIVFLSYFGNVMGKSLAFLVANYVCLLHFLQTDLSGESLLAAGAGTASSKARELWFMLIIYTVIIHR